MRTESVSINIANNKIGELLNTNKFVKLGELIVVFLVPIIFVLFFISNKDEDLLYNQGVLWLANIVMLTIVYTGMKLRGESLKHFGFSFDKFDRKFALKTLLQSILVFVFVVSAYVLGSIVMANISGIPESSDMSGYNYIKGNIWMLLISLIGVYIVSSIGEEVIYRAFLINRFSEIGLSSKTGEIIAVIISAVIFGFAHYNWGPMGIVQTGFMGLALGLSYVYLKKRIWVLILAHVYMDTILIVQMYFG